jgi:transposase InsO family protein
MACLLEVSTSGYYEFLDRKPSSRSLQNIQILERIKDSFERSLNLYGSPRVTEDLKAQGFSVGKNRIAKIMKNNDISPNKPKIFRICTTDSNHRFAVFPNRLNQAFRVGEIGVNYISDITYIQTLDGFCYLTTVLDLGNREVIGWNLSKEMKSEDIKVAIDKAFLRRPIRRGGLFHSDRGSQYASELIKETIKMNGALQSMSRRGNCYDNSVQESFFGTLKKECIYRLPRKVIFSELQNILFDYIECYYNTRRRHSSLGYNSPVKFAKLIA